MPVGIAGVRCTGQSAGYTFWSAADRRHMGLRDKLEVVSRQIGKEGLPYPMVSVIINLKLKSDVRTVEASYEKSRLV